MVKVVKRMFITILVLIALFLIGALLFINLSPEFGAESSSATLKQMRETPNYRDGAFYNPHKSSMKRAFKWSTLPKFFTSGDKVPANPEKMIPVKKRSKDHFNEKPPIRVTWLGHSSVLVEIAGNRLLLDPILYNSMGPLPLVTPERFNPEVPIKPEDLPEIDAVLISHDHYDHLDRETILTIKDKVKRFFVPLGTAAHLQHWGISKSKITELYWWQDAPLNNLKLVFTPAHHFSGRSPFNRNSTLWGGWVIKSNDHNIFFSGDSGYSKQFKEIGKRYGPFDLTMLECGQYNEQWGDIHMFPHQTAQAHLDLRGKLLLPIHWGAFKLSLHSWNDPVVQLSKAASRLNIKLTTPKIGESIIPGSVEPAEQWWVIKDNLPQN